MMVYWGGGVQANDGILGGGEEWGFKQMLKPQFKMLIYG